MIPMTFSGVNTVVMDSNGAKGHFNLIYNQVSKPLTKVGLSVLFKRRGTDSSKRLRYHRSYMDKIFVRMQVCQTSYEVILKRLNAIYCLEKDLGFNEATRMCSKYNVINEHGSFNESTHQFCHMTTYFFVLYLSYAVAVEKWFAPS